MERSEIIKFFKLFINLMNEKYGFDLIRGQFMGVRLKGLYLGFMLLLVIYQEVTYQQLSQFLFDQEVNEDRLNEIQVLAWHLKRKIKATGFVVDNVYERGYKLLKPDEEVK